MYVFGSGWCDVARVVWLVVGGEWVTGLILEDLLQEQIDSSIYSYIHRLEIKDAYIEERETGVAIIYR